MKCLLVADLHYALKQFDWIGRVAEDFDVIALAGDHLDISSTVALEAQIVVVLKYLRRLGSSTQLLVSSGNHDLTGSNEAGEKVARWMSRVRQLGVPTDGDRFDADDGTLFTICPWWDGPLTRDEVDAQLARDAEKRNGPWVWIYHSPPDDSPTSWAGQKHFGDADLAAWIERYSPDMVFTGHIHQSPFRKGGSWVDKIGDTWVFNSGRQIGPVPAHTIIDTGVERAMWFSLAGAEYVELDQPLERPVAELTGPLD